MIMGASNLMMGLTLVLVICLAVVLSLVLVLLAELYCSAILRRRNHRNTATSTAETTTNPSQPVTNFYSQSILSAPRNILYPSLAGAGTGIENPPENQESKKDSSFRNGYLENNPNNENNEDLVYISNPVFDDDDENGRRSKAAGNTPFETPETSPSRLETEGSSGSDVEGREEEITSVKVVVETPPLTPMKKLPATVNDGGDGGGDLNSNNCDGGSSSSSSETPCTSLSW